MNLYDLTVAAQSDISTYRHPNIEEWKAAIDPVLVAAGESSIGRDTIEDVLLSEDYLTIETSYVVRGCENSNTIRIPVELLQSANPVWEANAYRLRINVAAAQLRVSKAQSELNASTEMLAKLQAQLHEHLKAPENAE